MKSGRPQSSTSGLQRLADHSMNDLTMSSISGHILAAFILGGLDVGVPTKLNAGISSMASQHGSQVKS